jgi:hypothetical protein
MSGGFGWSPYGLGPYGDPSATYENEIQFSYVVNATLPDIGEVVTCRENFVDRMLRNLNRVFNRNRLDRGVLVTIFEAIAGEFCDLLERIMDALLQLNIATANGKFLDLWGRYFGEYRFPNEDDERFRMRLIAVLEQPKTTLAVIKKVISPYFLVQPTIKEFMIDGLDDPQSIVFPPGSVVDWIRRRNRLEIQFDEATPPVLGNFAQVFFVDYSFIGRESFEGPETTTPLPEAPPLEGYQSYVFDPHRLGLQHINLAEFKDLIDSIKAAGTKVYYKSGGTYV